MATAFFPITESAEITGTRTSGSVFTRTTGVWATGELVGKYAFSCAAGQYYTGSWLPIVGNDEITLTVSGTLDATGTGIRVCSWNPIAGLHDVDVSAYGALPGNGWFWGGCVDLNKNLWPAPAGAPDFVKFDTVNKRVVAKIPHGYSSDVYNIAFMQAACINGHIWPFPAGASEFVEIDPVSEQIIGRYPHGAGPATNPSGRFNGGCVAGDNIYLAAYGCTYMLKFNTVTKEPTRIPIENYQNGAVNYAIFDEIDSVWVALNTSFLKINMHTDEITEVPNPYWEQPSWDPDSEDSQPALYYGGCLDTDGHLCFSPYYGPLLRIDPQNNTFAKYNMFGDGANNWPRPGQFCGAVCDSKGIINLLPNNNNILTRVNLVTGTTLNYTMGQDWGAWGDGVIIDDVIYLFPSYSKYIAEVQLPASHLCDFVGFADLAAAQAYQAACDAAYGAAESLDLLHPVGGGYHAPEELGRGNHFVPIGTDRAGHYPSAPLVDGIEV